MIVALSRFVGRLPLAITPTGVAFTKKSVVIIIITIYYYLVINLG